MALRALARVNVAAIKRNVVTLRSGLSAGAKLCAVVKANASGHGAVRAAEAALAGGASSLAVATANEAAELRAGGLSAPILIMGALSDEELTIALEAGAELTAWDERFVDQVRARAPGPVAIHVKFDTGMGRLGTRELGEALAVADRVCKDGGPLRLAGAMTHFATADGELEYVQRQLAAFAPFVAELRRRAPGIVVHAANSAATLREPASHFDMVRCGIAIYGCDPMNVDAAAYGLEPALELSSYVAALKRAAPGQAVGYGRRFIAERETIIATLPIGYADGVRRALGGRLQALIGGRSYPVVGTISMDNITVDVGPAPDDSVIVGARAIVIGRDGDAGQSAEDLSNAIGSIAHEILCGISARVTRVYHCDGDPV